MVDELTLRPLNRQEVARVEGRRRMYAGIARAGKLVTLCSVGLFIVAFVGNGLVGPGNDMMAVGRRLLFLVLLFNALFVVFMIALGVWLWGRYMVQANSFLDDMRVDAKWQPLLSHDAYQRIKETQGGVYPFQFEQLKSRARW